MCSLNDSPCRRSVNESKACPVPVGNTICGETNSLEIMKEFNRLYEERMQEVDSKAGGDCLQEKIKLQQEWIRNLTQQNEMLVRAVQELEYEATERVQQLEEKLHKSAQCLCEGERLLKEKECTVQELTQKLQHYSTFGDVECLAKELKCRQEECESLKQTSYIADREKDSLKERIKSLESENSSLKETLTIEKTHIEELDEQFKGFLQDRDALKRKNKELEKKTKSYLKEKDALCCECETLKSEIQRIKQQNEKYLCEVDTTKQQLEALKAESKAYQRKIKEAAEENRKTFEQVLSLNEENRNLSKSIDVIRQRSEYTTSFTQEEITKLNATIEELHANLEKTRIAQDQEEMVHQKEISQLNKTISSLEEELKKFGEKYEKDIKTCKICRGKSKVGFLETSEVQANLESKESELVKALKDSESKMRLEIEKRNNEIQMLRNKVNELELALNTCEERAANLQEAVTLYSKSVSVLETTEEDAQNQIQQQKITIANLQQALVEAKQEVDELRRKTQENDIKKQGIVNMLQKVLNDTNEENEFIRKQSEIISKEYETLQDINFRLEVEHCDSLQDIDGLEIQLNKYKALFKQNEEQMKKLSKQKKCYEEIIAYFKHEMGLMADQLNNLQELLTLSNETAQQESTKIMHAFMEVQSLNEKLSSQLCACEQKVQLENQMNQLHEAKICELQHLIEEKEMDLTKHDQAILNIRKTLNDSLKQNEELQGTIFQLNETITQLQSAVNRYERENCATKRSCMEFQEQIGSYCGKLEELKKTLDEKTAEALKLEMAYNNEKRALKAAQKQLQETERLQKENHKDLVNGLDELKQKLTISNENNTKLCQECETLQNRLANLSRKEAVKDLEIKRYRKIVSDLKATMMELNSELNKNLAQKELGVCCKNVNCRRNIEKEDSKTQDICLSCPCEVEFYQKMVDILKKSVSELKRKLNETQQRNKCLDEEIKQKDKNLCELNQRLIQSQNNDIKTVDLEREIDKLRQELQLKTLQLEEVKKSAQEINGSKCVQLVCAEEEITNLKNEMASILNRQYCLKRENEELNTQIGQLHCQINCLNEQNKMFKEQIDQYLIKIRTLNNEKETLIRKNKELLCELRSLQSITCSVDKQQRERSFKSQAESPTKTFRANRSTPHGNVCTSPCSLGSQGTASFYDGESPPPSPEYGLNEWYSSTFRTESENDSEEDYCVNTLENLTQQMKKSNKIWMDEKRARRDCRVSKDKK